jgi:hypothetical protein
MVPRVVASHLRVLDAGVNNRITDPAHRPARNERVALPPTPEQLALREVPTDLDLWLKKFAAKTPGRLASASRMVLRMFREYPTAPLVESFRLAHEHGLLDLARVEKMVLARIAHDFFPDPHQRSTTP